MIKVKMTIKGMLLLSCFSCVRLSAFWRGLKWSWSGSRSRWIPTMVLRGRISRGFSASTVVFITLPSARASPARASWGDVLTGGSVTAALSLTSREQRPRVSSRPYCGGSGVVAGGEGGGQCSLDALPTCPVGLESGARREQCP